MTFYSDGPDDALRQGDLLSGLPTVLPRMGESAISALPHRYSLDVDVPQYCAVISPCCSIERGWIVVSPLSRVLGSFLKNPVFQRDLTSINRKLLPEESLAPEDWERQSPEDKERRRAEGMAYALFQYFVYGPHPLLATYVLKGQSIGHHMIDFTRSYTVLWPKKIERGLPPPRGLKILQLSVEARALLRDKLAAFHDRMPDEDRAILEG